MVATVTGLGLLLLSGSIDGADGTTLYPSPPTPLVISLDQNQHIPTPPVTPPALDEGVPTFDGSSITTFEDLELARGQHCSELGDFQGESRSLLSTDYLGVSESAALALGEDGVSVANGAIHRFNSIVPASCHIGPGRRSIFVTLPPMDNKNVLGYVSPVDSLCIEADPTIYIYPHRAGDKEDIKNTVIHEAAHIPCSNIIPESMVVRVGVNRKTIDAFWGKGVTRDILEYETTGLFVKWTNDLGEMQISNVFREVSADLVPLIDMKRDDPKFKEYKTFSEIEGIDGLNYLFLVEALHESLLLNGFEIPPYDLAYLFVAHLDNPNPLLEISKATDKYQDNNVPEDQKKHSLAVLLPFAAVNYDYDQWEDASLHEIFFRGIPSLSDLIGVGK